MLPKPALVAAAVLGIVALGCLIGLAYIDWRARQLAVLTSAGLHATSALLPDEPARSGGYQIVQVPPRGEQECLRENRGVVNETFLRCTQGYRYRRYVP